MAQHSRMCTRDVARRMRGPGARWVAAMAAIAVVASAAAAPAAGKAKPAGQDAMPIVKAMIQACRDAKTYRQRATTTVEMAGPGMLTRMWTTGTLVYKAPNLFAVHDEPSMQAKHIVCDGTSLFMWAESGGKVAKAPAPGDFREAKVGQALTPTGGLEAMTSGMTLPDFQGCLTGVFSLKMAKAARLGLAGRGGWAASLKAPAGAVAVTVEMQNGPPMVVWADAATHIPRQVAVEMSFADLMKGMIGAMAGAASEGAGGAGEAAAGAAPQAAGEAAESVVGGTSGAAGEMAQAMGGMTIRLCTVVHECALNKPVPAKAFAFKAPKGAQIVEVSSLGGIAQALGSGGSGAPGGEEPSSQAGPEEKNLEGKEPVDFQAQTLDGKTVSLSDFKGKPLIVDFWATWCPPCRAELPILDEIYGKMKDQGLQVVAICSDKRDALDKYLKEHPFSFTVLWVDPQGDQDKLATEAYGITAIPRTLYIGADWVVRRDATGLHEKAEMLKAVAALGLKVEGE